MKKPFCLYLTNQTRFDKDNLEPCCWYSKKCNIITNTVDQIVEYLDELKEIDSWRPGCFHCLDKERLGLESPRTQAEQNPKSVGVYSNNDIGQPTSMELQIDTSCNAACLMCGPYNSTTWQKHTSLATVNRSENNKIIDIKNAEQTQFRVERIKELAKQGVLSLANINQVIFLGGEPLDVELHKDILKEIQKYKSLDSVSLRYVTNGSKLPDNETLDLWSQVKDIKIVFSIDATGEQFNYLRWPLQWNQVDRNVKYFVDLNMPNMRFGISTGITPFNAFYYDRYLEWESNMFGNRCLDPNFRRVYEASGVLNTSSLPPALIEKISKKYSEHDWLCKRIRPFNQDSYDKFMNYIQRQDSRRNLNWQETFPELVEYFK